MKNFTKIATLKDSFTNLSHSLDAGQSIGLPTKWEFYLSQREDDFGIFFKLAENPTKAEEVLATFHVIIRLADGGEYRSLGKFQLSITQLINFTPELYTIWKFFAQNCPPLRYILYAILTIYQRTVIIYLIFLTLTRRKYEAGRNLASLFIYVYHPLVIH